MIYELLEKGKDNAKSTEELKKVLGLDSSRELTQLINEERNEGFIILSNASKGGYYRPDTMEELQAFVRNMDSRTLQIQKATSGARKLLSTLKDQGFNEADHIPPAAVLQIGKEKGR